MIKNKKFWVFAYASFAFLAFISVLIFFPVAQNFFLAVISDTSVKVLETGYKCITDSDCGIDGFAGSLFCQSNNVYQNYITHTCDQPGTASSSCVSLTTAQLQTTCAGNQTCSDGSCVLAENVGGGGGVSYYPTVITPAVPPEQQPAPLVPAAEQPQQPENPAENLVNNGQNQPTAQPVENPVVQPENIQQPTVTSGPLSLAVAGLSQKIPEFAGILSNLNIKNAQDVANLQNYNIFLPGLKEIGINKIPTDTMFVMLGNKNIDAETKLNFSSAAAAPEEINVLAAKQMHLVVKPSSPVKEVSGYVLFESPNLPNPNQNFSVLKFSYTENSDGTYVADINSPAVAGQYQIVTSIDYVDAKLGQKEIKTTTLVDPDGYIYENAGNGELRINGAVVSLYDLNSKNQYELWNAKEYGQENPQITDATGNYSFLVPVGTYYLTVKMPGYYSYQSNAFPVMEGKEIHSNVALKKEFNFYSLINWNTVLMIILFCLVFYNFYRDARREKLNRKDK
jgi:hypothetical protein